MIAKKWWDNFLERSPGYNIEEKRRKLVFYVASYAGGLITLFFSSQHISTQSFSPQLLFLGLLILLNVILSHFVNKKQPFFYTAGLLNGGLMLYLTISGGYNNTGLFWIFPLPIASFILLGYWIGLIFNSILYLLVSLLLLYQD